MRFSTVGNLIITGPVFLLSWF